MSMFFFHTSNYCFHTQQCAPLAGWALSWGGVFGLAGGGEEPKLPITILNSHTIGAALPVAVQAKARKSHLLSGAPLAGL